MISSFFIFLPCTFCLVAFLVSLSKWDIEKQDRYFMLVSLFAAIYFFMDAFYVHRIEDSYRLIVVFHIIGTTASLYLLPTFYIWMRTFQDKHIKSGVYVVGYSIALIHMIIMCTLYGIMGWSGAIDYIYHMANGIAFDPISSMKVQRVMFYICYLGYNIVMLTEIIFIMAYLALMIIRLIRVRNRSTEDKFLMRMYICAMSMFIIVFMRIGIGYEHMLRTPWLCSLMSALLATTIYSLYAHKFFHELVLAKTENSEMKRHVMDRAPSTLQANFEKHMIAEQAYLQPNITLEDVANAIGSNRTYLSQMLQQTYNMSFPDYINRRRIEYAQRYIAEHPDAIQEDVAMRSGYSGASAFNRKFKEITGMTPREWLYTRSAQH